jgi:hypothetical protein
MYTIGTNDETVTDKTNWHLMHSVICGVLGTMEALHSISHRVSDGIVHSYFLFFDLLG